MSRFTQKKSLIRKDMGKDGSTQDAAAAIGESMIRSVMEATGVTYDEAADQLLSGGMPDGVEAVSARAAQQLAELSLSGGLKGDVNEYIKDPEFISLLSKMPAEAAVMVYEANTENSDMRSSMKEERRLGEQDTLEKLLSRKTLPQSTRSSSPARTDLDFYSMSTDEFNALRDRVHKESSRR